jgi:hypothetical protein
MYQELIDYTLKRTSSETLYDMWWKEFIREDAKQKAYKTNCPRYPVWGQNAQYVSQYPGLHKPYAQAAQAAQAAQLDRDEMIGCLGHICNNCFEIELFTIRNTYKSLVIPHTCKTEVLGKALLLNEMQKLIKLKEGQMQIPFLL